MTKSGASIQRRPASTTSWKDSAVAADTSAVELAVDKPDPQAEKEFEERKLSADDIVGEIKYIFCYI